MKKKSLLIAMAAMSVAAIGAGTVSTMAWYSATASNKYVNMVASGTISVGQASTSNDNVYFNVAPNTDAATSLYLTNRTGRTYFRSGDAYKEILADDNGSTLATPAATNPVADAVVKKQAGVAWKVWLSTESGGGTAPSKAALGSIAGTYTVKIKASGAIKASTTQTTALVTDKSPVPVYNFNLKNNTDDDSEQAITAASGALGEEANKVITLGTIIIAADGNVTETIHQSAATAWSTVSTAVVDDETVYYGIECTSNTADASPSESGALTPSVELNGTPLNNN